MWERRVYKENSCYCASPSLLFFTVTSERCHKWIPSEVNNSTSEHRQKWIPPQVNTKVKTTTAPPLVETNRTVILPQAPSSRQCLYEKKNTIYTYLLYLHGHLQLQRHLHLHRNLHLHRHLHLYIHLHLHLNLYLHFHLYLPYLYLPYLCRFYLYLYLPCTSICTFPLACIHSLTCNCLTCTCPTCACPTSACTCLAPPSVPSLPTNTLLANNFNQSQHHNITTNQDNQPREVHILSLCR